jgi:RNA polymerase sigma-70 factor (ECF subfamily)
MSGRLDSEEPILVALAQSGDRDALEALLRRNYQRLRAFVTPMVGGSHVDDVLQEIALAVFQNIRYLRHPGAFRAWAYRLASRRAFRHLKRELRWARLDTNPETLAALPAQDPLPDVLEPKLFEAIEHVSPASRAVLLLHYQHDLSIEETAIVLDIPVGTAKSRLAYGISVLRKLITQKGTQ